MAETAKLLTVSRAEFLQGVSASFRRFPPLRAIVGKGSISQRFEVSALSAFSARRFAVSSKGRGPADRDWWRRARSGRGGRARVCRAVGVRDRTWLKLPTKDWSVPKYRFAHCQASLLAYLRRSIEFSGAIAPENAHPGPQRADMSSRRMGTSKHHRGGQRFSPNSEIPTDCGGVTRWLHALAVCRGRRMKCARRSRDPAVTRGAGEIELHDQVVVVAVAAAIGVFPAPGVQPVVPQVADRLSVHCFVGLGEA